MREHHVHRFTADGAVVVVEVIAARRPLCEPLTGLIVLSAAVAVVRGPGVLPERK